MLSCAENRLENRNLPLGNGSHACIFCHSKNGGLAAVANLSGHAHNLLRPEWLLVRVPVRLVDIMHMPRLLNLSIDKEFECPVAMRDPVQTPCGHEFCKSCFSQVARSETRLIATFPYALSRPDL